MQQKTKNEFLAMFDESVHDIVVAKIREFGATAIVCFENQQMDSTQFGARTAMPVGPRNSFKNVEDVKGKHLNDLPSQRQYPVAYVEASELAD